MTHSHGDHSHSHEGDHEGHSHTHDAHLPEHGPSFHEFIPAPTVPRIAGMLGKNAHEHGEAGLKNPIVRELLIDGWERAYQEPFKGVTTDGRVREGLFSLAS